MKDRRIYTETMPYWYKDFKQNIPFLERMIDCIEGDVDPEVIDATVLQLKMMIEEEKERIKKEPKNGSLSPKLIRR